MGEDGLTGQDYPAYCAVALAVLGSLPETIADRAVIIRMKKRRADESISPWRERVNANEARAIAAELGNWMASVTMRWPAHMPVEDRQPMCGKHWSWWPTRLGSLAVLRAHSGNRAHIWR